MRRCGKGYHGLRRFLAIINHPPPMTEKNYRKISHSFTEAVRAVALKSMNDAAEDIRCNDDNVVDIGVSLDRTWQRRGFSAKKSRFIKYKQFATSIFDATAHFNIGNLATLIATSLATLMIYDKLDI